MAMAMKLFLCALGVLGGSLCSIVEFGLKDGSRSMPLHAFFDLARDYSFPISYIPETVDTPKGSMFYSECSASPRS